MEKEITTEEILAELGYSVENLPANTGEVSSFAEALPQLRQHYDRLTPLGFRALKCFGYSENNTKTDDKEKYAQAKAPIFQGWNNSDYKGLTFTEFATWIRQGGWIGWTIPVGLVVIDVETKDVIDKIFKLAHYKKLKCWIHKTTNGYHIFFKAPGVDVSANSNGKTSLGNVTYRIGGKNMLIFAPIMDRKWIDFKVGIEELSELPKELYPLVEGTTTTTSKAMYTTHKGVTDAWGGVEEGNRTLSLAKLVGSLKSDGISAENAISLLLAWNLRNNPPLPDDDVIKQVNDMYNRYPQSKITNAQRSTENQPVPSNQSVPARQISCLPYSPVIPVGFHVQIEVLDGREVLEESVLAVRVEKDGITHYFSLCTPFFIAEYINTCGFRGWRTPVKP